MFRNRFCILYAEEGLKSLRERENESKEPEPEPEPTTEVLFLCSYDGCGKTFIDAGALRKHSHIHGERQYLCHYEGCGKVLLSLLQCFSICFPVKAHDLITMQSCTILKIISSLS